MANWLRCSKSPHGDLPYPPSKGGKAWRQGIARRSLLYHLSYSHLAMADGTRTRDTGLSRHVVPRAFATTSGKATTKVWRELLLPAMRGGDHVLPPVFAAVNPDRPDRTKESDREWVCVQDMYSRSGIQARTAKTVADYTSTASISRTQCSPSNCPAANRASTSNTASENPPTFNTSSRVCACTVA